VVPDLYVHRLPAESHRIADHEALETEIIPQELGKELVVIASVLAAYLL